MHKLFVVRSCICLYTYSNLLTKLLERLTWQEYFSEIHNCLQFYVSSHLQEFGAQLLLQIPFWEKLMEPTQKEQN